MKNKKNLKISKGELSTTESIQPVEDFSSSKTYWNANDTKSSQPRPKGGRPSQSKVKTPWIETRLSKLKEVRALTWALEPNKLATQAATYYLLTNDSNPVRTAQFSGNDNLSGNTISRLLTLNNSSINYNFDSLNFELAMNYMFLNYSATDGQTAGNTIYSQAVVEALAETHSNILTDLLFSKSTGVTNMRGLSDNRVASLVHYQTFCQNLALINTKYNQLMLLTNELTNMGYNAESANTEELFALFKRSTFVARLKAMSKYLMSKYFDFSWQRKFSNITDVPSRKSSSIREPLLTASCFYVMPEAKLTSDGTSYWYDSTTMITQSEMLDVVSGVVTPVPSADIGTLTRMFCHLMDQSTILKWSRAKFYGNSTVSALQYYNAVVTILNAVTAVSDKFVAQATDIEVYLDRAKYANLTQWEKGATFEPIMTSGSVSYNVIIHSILKNSRATPSTATWSPHIQAWVFSTFWDEFSGVPEYDMNTGGSYLTFSVRNVQLGTHGTLGVLSEDDPAAILPKLFSLNGNPVMINRLGEKYEIASATLTPSQVLADPNIARIIPYQDMVTDNYAITLPSVTFTASSDQIATTDSWRFSAAHYILSNLFGIGQIRFPQSSGSGDPVQVTSNFVNPTIISVLDVVMDNNSSEMINFLRANSPLRVYVDRGNSKIGMAGLE